jgi:thiamine kinase-like enzyme
VSEERVISERTIGRTWRKLNFSEQIGSVLKDSVSLSKEHRVCLKDSFKSSIWSLEANGKNKTYPVILKIFKPVNRTESLVELNMYRKAGKLLHGLMPDIYFIEQRVNGNEWWVCMEHNKPVKGQLVFTPRHFLNIIPSLAELHARTYNDKFKSHKSLFSDWLPVYQSVVMKRERHETNEKTKLLLEEAMNHPHLKEMIQPSYSTIKKLLQKGSLYFPEMIEAGQSIVHSDLQTANMCCSDITKKNWPIKFIDWEGAKYAPCWFDMVNMVGIFFAYRKDWRAHEQAITQQCVQLYAQEMKKRGIVWKQDPYKLYKMTFLQRILEKTLFLQLNWEVKGIKKGLLLPGIVDKINRWGKELKLF